MCVCVCMCLYVIKIIVIGANQDDIPSLVSVLFHPYSCKYFVSTCYSMLCCEIWSYFMSENILQRRALQSVLAVV